MKTKVLEHIEVLVKRYPALEVVKNEIIAAYQIIEKSYKNSGKLLVAGNGGSAADAEHIVGELMKGFKLPRKTQVDFAEKLVEENKELGTVLAENLQGALPAIALDGHPALSTAYMNDCEPLLCFAQQVNGYGKEGDVFLAISTSGNSKNILYAATTAHAKGMKVIGLTGAKSSKLEQMSDVCIKVPQTETYMIQELHLPVYHCFLANYGTDMKGMDVGYKIVQKQELTVNGNTAFDEVIKTRRAVRTFSDKKLEPNVVKECVLLAQAAPTACNRQMIKIYQISNRENCDIITDTIYGASGFTRDTVNYFVLTYDVKSLDYYGERNQGYLNAGLVAMNLANALHSRGIGSCFIQCLYYYTVHFFPRKHFRIPILSSPYNPISLLIKKYTFHTFTFSSAIDISLQIQDTKYSHCQTLRFSQLRNKIV